MFKKPLRKNHGSINRTWSTYTCDIKRVKLPLTNEKMEIGSIIYNNAAVEEVISIQLSFV